MNISYGLLKILNVKNTIAQKKTKFRRLIGFRRPVILETFQPKT